MKIVFKDTFINRLESQLNIYHLIALKEPENLSLIFS